MKGCYMPCRFAMKHLAICVLALSACAKEAAPPAEYHAPTGYEATKAYERHLASAHVPGVSSRDAMPEEGLNAFNYHRAARAQRRESNNDRVASAVETLRRAEIRECRWRSFDLGDLPGDPRAEVENPPSHAHLCTINVVHDAQSRSRGSGDARLFLSCRRPVHLRRAVRARLQAST